MDDGLNELVSQYAADLMPNQATNPTFTFVDIGIDSKEDFDAVREFSEKQWINNEVYRLGC